MSTKKGSRRGFWHDLWSAWWERFPWKLNDEDEPPADPDELARLGEVTPDEEGLKKEVEAALADVGENLQPSLVTIDQSAFQRLSHWFANHATAKRDTLPWFTLLQRLHQIRNPHPRRRSAVQQFLSGYPDEVEEAFLQRVGDKTLTNAQKMNLRYDVAKTLLAEQYSHLKSELEDIAAEQYEVDLSQWNLVLDGISLAEDVSQ